MGKGYPLEKVLSTALAWTRRFKIPYIRREHCMTWLYATSYNQTHEFQYYWLAVHSYDDVYYEGEMLRCLFDEEHPHQSSTAWRHSIAATSPPGPTRHRLLCALRPARYSFIIGRDQTYRRPPCRYHISANALHRRRHSSKKTAAAAAAATAAETTLNFSFLLRQSTKRFRRRRPLVLSKIINILRLA